MLILIFSLTYSQRSLDMSSLVDVSAVDLGLKSCFLITGLERYLEGILAFTIAVYMLEGVLDKKDLITFIY